MNDQPKQPPRGRRLVRVAVWSTFAAVVFLRFVLFKEPPPERFPRHADFTRGEPRFRYRQTVIEPPVAEVPNDLFRLRIEIEPKDAELLRGYYWNGWRGEPTRERPEVQVTVREGGLVYTNVSLHSKGAAGSFRQFDDKPALTLNFAKHAAGQKFHGYSKISLNNSVQDPTFINEVLARELFDRAGVPVPKADYATVIINGRDLGLYVLVEGYNKDFLRRYFKNVQGNLYDGGFCQDVNRDLKVNSGGQPDDRSDLDRLLGAATDSSLSARARRLESVLDTERFTTMLALEVMLCHWDGYGLNRNNYRLFHDRTMNRMVFMPHGMDQLFETPPHRFPIDSSLQPSMRGEIARAWLSTPMGGRRYFERVQALHTNLLQEDAILARVHALAARIRPTLEAYSPSVASRHDAAVASLCDRIQRRLQNIGEQLQAPSQPLSFDQSGTAAITNWNERTTSRHAVFRMEQLEQDGRSLLYLAPIGRDGTAAWRTRVLLEAGRYRLEGRAKLSENAGGSRVCLRVSGGSPMPSAVVASNGWVFLSYPFAVDAYLSETLLMCEFRGARGEAWFDLSTLRLIREVD